MLRWGIIGICLYFFFGLGTFQDVQRPLRAFPILAVWYLLHGISWEMPSDSETSSVAPSRYFDDASPQESDRMLAYPILVGI